MSQDLQIGAFARIWSGETASSVASAMKDATMDTAQWNFVALGRPAIDPSVTTDECASIAGQFAQSGVSIWGLSCTFNIAHPDQEIRDAHVERGLAQIGLAPALGVKVVTLCTGSRNPDNMWAWHPDNSSAAAWDTARSVLARLAEAASDHGVLLGIEPEPGNVVTGTEAAVRMLDSFGDRSPFTIVLDPANLLTVDTLPDQEAILTRAFEALGSRTAGLHAKDVVASGYSAAGVGGMDYEIIAGLHQRFTPSAPVIIQDSRADDVERTAQFLRSAWATASRS